MNGETKPSQFKLGHRPVLDGVRGLSILIVMFEHGFLFKYGRGGFLGVDIFFVLSGLLITSLLAQEWQETGSLSFKKFYARRALRLLPAVIALIIFTFIQATIFPPQVGRLPVYQHLLGVLLYVENWAGGYTMIGHTWSLSIEEQFYIAWPLLFFLLLKLKLTPLKIIAVLCGMVGLVVIHRARMFYVRYGFHLPQFEMSLLRLYTGTDTRCDSLLIGCIAGILFSWQMIPTRASFLSKWRPFVLISCGLMSAAIIIVPIFWSYLYLGGFTVFGIAAASSTLFILIANKSWLSQLMQWSVLRWFGRLSYSLYLWHVTVYSFYVNNFGPLPIKSYTLKIMIPLAIKFAGSVALACVSFYLIEQPFLRLKKRFSVVSSSDTPGERSPRWKFFRSASTGADLRRPGDPPAAITPLEAELPGSMSGA